MENDESYLLKSKEKATKQIELIVNRIEREADAILKKIEHRHSSNPRA